jgi:hypothetical protein
MAEENEQIQVPRTEEETADHTSALTKFGDGRPPGQFDVILATAAQSVDESDTSGFWATPALGLAYGLSKIFPQPTQKPEERPPGQWNDSVP